MTYYEEGRKKGGFWGKFLAVVLGFLFGIIATIGSIAAVGYYLVARMTIRQGIEFVGNLTGKDVDYMDYITDEYANETVMGLVGELQKLSESLSDKTITLADLNAISPLVEKQVTDLSARLAADFRIPLAVNSAYHGEDGSVLDEEGNVIIDASGNVVKKDENGRADFTGKDGEMLVGLMDLPFGEISTFLVDSLAPVQVGAVLSAPEVGMLTPNSENYDLLMLVCYGDKGNYKTNEAGDIVLDENGNAEMLGGAKATTFGNLLGFGGNGGMEAIIQNMSVAGLMEATGSLDDSDELVRALLYGVEGVHYAVGTEGEIEMLRVGIAVYGGAAYDRGGNLLPGAVEETEGDYLYTDGDTVYRLERQSEESIEIETEEGPLSLPLLIAEDETGEEVFYKPHTIGDLSGENSLISGITKDLTIGQFMGDGEQSSLSAAISAWKIDDLNDQDKIMSLKIADVIGVDENSPAVLQAMRDRDWTLAYLNDKDTFNQLALGEVIEIDESNPDTPALLVSLQNTSIGKLSDAVNRLTLVELLGEDQVEKSSILRNLADSTAKTLADDISALSIAQVFEDKVYKTDGDGNYLDENGNVLYYNDTDGNWYTSPDFAADTRSERVLTGTWKYLLTGDKAAEEYTLEDIGDLTANMTKNVQSAALNDLYADGVIETQDGSGDLTFLTEKILYEATVSVGGIRYTVLSIDPAEFSDKQTIGELTIQELIDYVRAVISALNEMA
ncbi:MAG TPA: hypothetical protein IAB32_06230 [Candidatus Scatosoma pullicola]|nr:hypothetical protein [Candidatus Scatosoma pullicola]